MRRKIESNVFLMMAVLTLLLALGASMASAGGGWGGHGFPTPPPGSGKATATPNDRCDRICPDGYELILPQCVCQKEGGRPTNTPRPRATNTPRPTATRRPTVTRRPTSTPRPRPTSTPRPTATPRPRPTATPKPTATPRPRPTNTPRPRPTSTPRPTATRRPTPRPTATQQNQCNLYCAIGYLDPVLCMCIVPTAAPTNTPRPTSTPRPTATPRPTNTPRPTDTPAPTPTPAPGCTTTEWTEVHKPYAAYTREPRYPIVNGQDPEHVGFRLKITVHAGYAERIRRRPVRHCDSPGCVRWHWVCIEGPVAFYSDPVKTVDLGMRLADSSVAWINGELASRYYGAHQRDGFPSLFRLYSGRGVTWRRLTFRYHPTDPGVYGGRIILETVGTPLSRSQHVFVPFSVPVYLKEATEWQEGER